MFLLNLMNVHLHSKSKSVFLGRVDDNNLIHLLNCDKKAPIISGHLTHIRSHSLSMPLCLSLYVCICMCLSFSFKPKLTAVVKLFFVILSLFMLILRRIFLNQVPSSYLSYQKFIKLSNNQQWATLYNKLALVGF